MSTTTHIEWTDKTWNPVVGCTRVSKGCDHCYAVRMSHRLRRHEGYAGLTVLNDKGDRHFNGVVRCLPERLSDPLHWRKPCRVFVNSMSDLFHEKVDFEFIHRVFGIAAICPQHDFQILTKRPQIASRYCDWVRENHWSGGCVFFPRELPLNGTDAQIDASRRGQPWPLPNVWLGTSCEDQATADERIPHLLRCPAAVRFLSVEPLLGPVDLRSAFAGHCEEHDFPGGLCVQRHHAGVNHLGWIIAGGESGPGARPMHPDWVRSIRDQCQAAAVPFFFKQWGEYKPWIGSTLDSLKLDDKRRQAAVRLDGSRSELCESGVALMSRVGKKAAGAEFDGREWREYPA